MMTPLEIQNKEFRKRFGSYNAGEVNDFIDKVYSEFDRLYRENADLKEKINVYDEKLEHYISIEKTLQSTLTIAQTMSEEIIQNARKKAENITKEGEMNAAKIIEQANNSLIDLKLEFEKNRKECVVFKARFKAFVEGELENLKDLDEALEMHKLETGKNIEIKTEKNYEEKYEEPVFGVVNKKSTDIPDPSIIV